jgi:hypothetical protein
MSTEINVRLKRHSLPTPFIWQNAIRDAGFQMEIDSDFDPYHHGGFLPCSVEGKESGFEYYTDVHKDPKSLNFPNIRELEMAVSFVTHSDFLELACAVMASGVLCLISNGTLLETESQPLVTKEEVNAWMIFRLKEINEFI